MISVVINQQGVKRQLDGPFEICASRETLEVMRKRIDEFLSSESVYGWLTIYEAPRVESVPNTQPIPWK